MSLLGTLVILLVLSCCGLFFFYFYGALIFTGGSHHLPVPETLPDTEETDVSLITGKLRRLGEGDVNNIETGTALVLKTDNMVVANQAETACKYLSYRNNPIFLD